MIDNQMVIIFNHR